MACLAPLAAGARTSAASWWKGRQAGRFSSPARTWREFEAIAGRPPARRKNRPWARRSSTGSTDLPFPTVAVLNGAAAGGGLELGPGLRFSPGERQPADPAQLSGNLPRPAARLGRAPTGCPGWSALVQALQIILFGKTLDGVQAARIRLVDACYPKRSSRTGPRSSSAPCSPAGGGRRWSAGRRSRKLQRRLAEDTALGRSLVFPPGAQRPGGPARRPLSRPAGRPRGAGAGAWRAPRAPGSADRAKGPEQAASPAPSAGTWSGCSSPGRRRRRIPPCRGNPPEARVGRAAVLGAGYHGGRIAWLFTPARHSGA